MSSSAPDLQPPWSIRQIITFTGQLPSQPPKWFNVLAGDGAPTIKGGFTKINTIDRPRRLGFTMPTGWDPMSVDVPVRFEAVSAYQRANLYPEGPAGLEKAITILEWMGGRGKQYARDGDRPAEGNPPTVSIVSYDGGNPPQPSNLIPPNLHGVAFLISNIAYDDHPIRGSEGDRRRQDAVVSLTQLVAVPGALFATSQPHAPKPRIVSFHSDHFHNTIQKVCEFHHIRSHSAWRQVVAFNRDRLHVRSYLQPLPLGTRIDIPIGIIN